MAIKKLLPYLGFALTANEHPPLIAKAKVGGSSKKLRAKRKRERQSKKINRK